jgi:DNA-binding Xre family transcriptional regulator
MSNPNIHIGELILQKLKEKNLPVAWLAGKVGMDPSNLRKQLKKISIDTHLLQHISKELSCNFFQYYMDQENG